MAVMAPSGPLNSIGQKRLCLKKSLWTSSRTHASQLDSLMFSKVAFARLAAASNRSSKPAMFFFGSL